jgi:parvulin-like peptidyl-prolyl isomerase
MRQATSWRQPQLMIAVILLLASATPSVWSQTARPAPAQPQTQTPALTPPDTQSNTQTLPASQSADQKDVIVLDEIVAKVNNEIITLSDFNRELQNWRNEMADQIRDPQALDQEIQKRRGMVLRNLIDSKMMIQKAEELGITANMDVEVAATIEDLRKKNGFPNNDAFDQTLRQHGSSLDQMRAQIKREMTVRSLVEQFVYSKLTLLTPEVEAYYKQNLQRFTEPAEVELSEILFLTEGKDKAQVRKRAEEVLARLKAGAAFEDEAQKSSEGPTASRGGNIGWFKKGSMAPALEAVVFNMKPGEISNVIETDYGFQIVKLINKKENQVKPLAEVRPIIQNELYQKKAAPELKEFLDDLRSQSYIYVAPDFKKEYDDAEQQQAGL